MTALSIWSTIQGRVPSAGLCKPRRGSPTWLPSGVDRCSSVAETGRPQRSATTDSAIDRPHRAQHGAALVEFVLVAPVLLMLLFGIWEFGRIFDAWQVVTNASREGARYAIEWSPADGDITTYVVGKVTNYLDSGYGARLSNPGGDITITSILVDNTAGGGPVTVAVTAQVAIFAPGPLVPFLGASGTFPVSAWTTMDQ